MQSVSLDLIRPSKNPIRQTRDEEKIKELAQSIAEKGVLQPIKVRPIRDDIVPCRKHHFDVLENEFLGGMDECLWCGELLGKVSNYDDGEIEFMPSFEIVFGGRRFEASLILKLETIPAIIEEMDNDNAIGEGLIENIQKEDMLDIEIAYAAYQYVYGVSYRQRDLTPLSIRSGSGKDGGNVEKKKAKLTQLLGITREQLSRYLGMLTDKRKPIVDEFYQANPNIKDVKTKAEWLQQAMPNEDAETQKAVARKSVKEELGQRKVKQLAQSVANAPTSEAKEKLLEWEFNSTIHNPDNVKERAKRLGAHDPLYLNETPLLQDEWDKVPEVKVMIDGLIETIKLFTKSIKEISKISKVEGKLSFEAKQFTANRLRKFRDEINDLLNQLEGKE